MSANEVREKTPNERLADVVVGRLKESGFVPEGRANEMLAKVASGTATTQDWNLWIDMAIAKKKENADGTH